MVSGKISSINRMSLQHDEERGLAKYRVTIQNTEGIELAEMGFCRETRLFPAGELSFERVMGPYERCEAYQWLSSHARHEAMFEMQTILHQSEQRVTQGVINLQNQWIRDWENPGVELIERQIIPAAAAAPERDEYML